MENPVRNILMFVYLTHCSKSNDINFVFNSEALTCHDKGVTWHVPITCGSTQEVRTCKWSYVSCSWGKSSWAWMRNFILLTLPWDSTSVNCLCGNVFLCVCISLKKIRTPFFRRDHSSVLSWLSVKPIAYWPLEPCLWWPSRKRTSILAWCISWHVIMPFTSHILSVLPHCSLCSRQKSSWMPSMTRTWLLHIKRLWLSGKSSLLNRAARHYFFISGCHNRTLYWPIW